MNRDRHLPFVGVNNFRDLGGYEAADGRTTRWGRLYRSDALHRLTSADLELLRSLGLATVIDLRSAAEIEYSGRGLVATEAIRFVNASVAHETLAQALPASDDDGDLVQRYLGYVRDGEFFVRTVSEMLDEANYPIVVNCFFGKDRTGVVLALILRCIGIDAATVAEDYGLSRLGMPSIIDTLRRDSVYGETIDRANPALFDAEPTTMARFLVAIDERYGGARAWALRAGVEAYELDLLAAMLLE